MVRLIVEAFGRAWVASLDSAKVVEPAQEKEEKPDFQYAPVDPHTVAGCHVEHGPGADSFNSDVTAAKAEQPPVRPGFGFRRGG
jgi:hypothetical protein